MAWCECAGKNPPWSATCVSPGGEQHREPGLGVWCHSSCLSHGRFPQMMSSPQDLNHANASEVILPARRSWTWRGVSVPGKIRRGQPCAHGGHMRHVGKMMGYDGRRRGVTAVWVLLYEIKWDSRKGVF